MTDEKEAEPAAEKFMVSTQMLFLYFLYSKKISVIYLRGNKRVAFYSNDYEPGSKTIRNGKDMHC